MMNTVDNEGRIQKLLHLRRGKKGAITKRITKLQQHMNDGLSRTKIKFLLTALYECMRRLNVDCDELFSLMTEPDVEWLEEVKSSVDECAADVTAYLEQHKDDTTSSGKSFTDSWVRQHAPMAQDFGGTDSGEQDMADLSSQMDRTHLTDHEKTPFTSQLQFTLSESVGLRAQQEDASSFSLFACHPSIGGGAIPRRKADEARHKTDTTFGPWNDAAYWKNHFARKDQCADPYGNVSKPQAFNFDNASGYPRYFDVTPGGFPRGSSSAPHVSSVYNYSHGVPTAQRQTRQLPQRFCNAPLLAENEVDSWIDNLDERHSDLPSPDADDLPNNLTVGWFVQQTLPRSKIPVFDGSPAGWVPFITKFYNLVHKQVYLTHAQRHMYLLDHLTGEPKTAVKCYSDNWKGYVLALKSLKFTFGQRSLIAQATLVTVTRGKPVLDDDTKALTDFYYTVKECLVTLQQLNYESDLLSTDTLRQTVLRLPVRMQRKWAQYSRVSRGRGAELNLLHFETWLHECILDRKESCWPDQQRKKPLPPVSGASSNSKLAYSTMVKRGISCPLCQKTHYLRKCEKYILMDDETKLATVQSLKLCFNCIKVDHKSANCQSKTGCRHPGCGKRHHTSLHNVQITPSAKSTVKLDGSASSTHSSGKTEDPHAAKDEEAKSPTPEALTPHMTIVSMLKSPKQVILLVVPIVLHSPVSGECVYTFAFLDNGSQGSFLCEDIALKLGLRGKPDTIGLSTIKDKPGTSEEIAVMDIKDLVVSSQDGSYRRTIDEVSVVSNKQFNLPGRKHVADLSDPDVYTHLDGINIDPIDPNDVTMLIGGNVPEAVFALEMRYGGKGQPLAVKTVFGWTLYGPAGSTSMIPKRTASVNFLLTSRAPPPSPQVDNLVAGLWKDNTRSQVSSRITDMATPQSRADEVLHHLVEGMWKQEVTPIAPGGDVAPSREDIAASVKLEEETVLSNNHYQVPMLWENANVKLPGNIGLAHKRFNFLRTKLRRDVPLYTKYKETFNKYISKGYAKRLSVLEESQTSNRTWYLPHFPVIKPNKPKIRVVKDAAATYEGKSLNSSLITGPDLLRPLHGVLNRFRKGKYAIVADIEEMYHQVKVSRDDADSLRFLWTDDIFSNNTHTLQMLVHIFGAKCSPTCANYALQRTARDNQHSFDPLTVETVLKSFYMDDLLSSVDAVEVACKLANELITLLEQGGFHLTKFMSNSEEVLASLPAGDRSQKTFLNLGEGATQQALGLTWELSSDSITFTFTFPDGQNTKRGILRVTASLFDPLGLVVPFLLTPKLLLRELWRRNIGWDEDIDETLLAVWTRWQEMARHLPEIKIARCFNLHDSPVREIQLHVFADASENAYGAAGYLRFSYKDGSHACTLVMAKSKLAPLKTVSLPRLELSAAVTAVRLYRNMIFDVDLPVERVIFWSDSTLVLQYINNSTHRFKTLVANSVTEIGESSTPEQWMRVPGPLNPADLLTRGVKDPRVLLETNKNGVSWFGGAPYLKEDEEKWPATNLIPLDDANPEIKQKPVLVALGLLRQPDIEQSDDNLQRMVVDSERFSSWTKLSRVVGWVRRFIHNRFAKAADMKKGDLSCEEIETAENKIVQLVQTDTFSSEIAILNSKGALPLKHKLSPLSPYVDSDRVLRVGGRLRNAQIPVAAKNQMILPKDHPVTRLLILHNHRKNGHVGQEHVLANLREKYWILNGRVAVRSLLRRCLLCKIKRARRMYPFMADLPVGRLASEEPPFTNCGVDLFGPIYIKQGRKQLKRWGVIFTCLTVRCVHLELVESLETDDFINCLRRFVNRRGAPKKMHSDRGSNFTGTTSELKHAIKSMDNEKISTFATSRQFTWIFNPAAAPHMGGAWERLVKSTKEVLTSLMKEQSKLLTDQQLHTLLTEVERILNAHPLTHISDDVNDLEPLTPNHILLGLHRQWAFISDVEEYEVTSRRKYRQVQALALEFWRRWRREYLPKLTTRSRWRQHIANIREGQLVLLVDDDNKRNWSLARVTHVFPGADDTVRAVEVKTKDGCYTRPVAKICSLEDDVINEVPQGEGHVTDD